MKAKDSLLEQNFGMARIIEPTWAIPVAAWKLDNKKQVYEDEMRVRVKKIKIEDASFRQLCQACGYDKEKIKQKILDIVDKRGKLHNPATDSGGIFYGEIEEIGKVFAMKRNVHMHDKIICITSLTGLPLHLSRIEKIDFNYGQIDVEGYAVLFSTCPFISVPKGLDISYTLAAMEESSSIYRIFQRAEAEKETGTRFLVLGSDLLSSFLYISAIRKAAGDHCRIVCAMDKESMERFSKEDIYEVLCKFADAIYILDIITPLESFEKIQAEEGELFDFSINCADILGAEAISVLLTKEHGTVIFTSFINSRNVAVLFAESLSKELSTFSFDEYTDGYENFTIQFVREKKADLEHLDTIYAAHPGIPAVIAKNRGVSLFHEAGRAGDFVFQSDTMKELVEEALNIADYDCNVVLQGETGVGKEKVLSLIHANSNRKFNPCIKINCAAIPEHLAESEFFGYEAGAFTGSIAKGKPGYFELANNGILFLDEVGLLPLSMQAKLLRVLQENQFFRIGGQNLIDVSVRVICASNIPLSSMVESGVFREDLYYRLNVYEITIPPLRERPEDISCLADHFLRKYNDFYKRQKHIQPSTLDLMTRHGWPGNVRELENTVHRLVIGSRRDIIDDADLMRILKPNPHELSQENTSAFGLDNAMMQYEKGLLEEALLKYKSTRKAAEYLGISQSQLMRKKQKYNIKSSKK